MIRCDAITKNGKRCKNEAKFYSKLKKAHLCAKHKTLHVIIYR